MTDTDALTKRMAQTVWEVCTGPFTPTISAASANEVAIALAPIVAEEVRKAKAEALREAAREEFQFSPNVHYQGIRVHERLVKRAYRIETGDSDEHR